MSSLLQSVLSSKLANASLDSRENTEHGAGLEDWEEVHTSDEELVGECSQDAGETAWMLARCTFLAISALTATSFIRVLRGLQASQQLQGQHQAHLPTSVDLHRQASPTHRLEASRR